MYQGVVRLDGVLTGSRFLRPSESPRKKEKALQLFGSNHGTSHEDKLLVLADHQPLVKLFGHRALNEIANATFWVEAEKCFVGIQDKPGNLHFSPDAINCLFTITVKLRKNNIHVKKEHTVLTRTYITN